MKISAAIHSMRLRTLPLSLAGVVLGIFLACANHSVEPLVIIFILLTTVCLQILSNLSNELGDYLSGTDGGQREGPLYSLAEGNISVQQFKTLITVFVFLCFFFGSAMIIDAFGSLFCAKGLVLAALGACAVWAAMHYTLGKRPYGYRGLGDISVFIFFGLVSVMGGYFVAAGTFDTWTVLLPAVCIGCFSVGVLNTNNIRDMESDAETRVTIPLKIGERNAKIYQTVLIVGGWVCMGAFTLLTYSSPWNLLYLLTLPLYIAHVMGVWRHHGSALDKYLPLLVISSFVFSILAGVGYLW
ncbi:MAG: 1,4-dihydroxy-2-naphthoate octaprenyltransferase [Bacteroidales bacterium]|nr:1,4-dihydroxy-2-naphthoate octaprenyltransferase [Bacteroidales bacterium]